MKKKFTLSKKDKEDWKNFLEDTSRVPDKDQKGKIDSTINKFKFDLHGLTLDEANKTIENFIYSAYSENVNKLVVVTGKGLHSENEKDPYVSKELGILKYSRLEASAKEFGGINIDFSPLTVIKLSSLKLFGSAIAPFMFVNILNSDPQRRSYPNEFNP